MDELVSELAKLSEKPEEPITEQKNTKSRNIDTATVHEIINILHDCESEIFTGWKNYQRIRDADFVGKLTKISKYAASLMKDSTNNIIILSGCGTSGRIAFFLTTKMNSLLREKGLPPLFDYIIAGGNKALTHSVEAFEDSPEAGRQELIKVSHGRRKVLFIGISCGLSAPFVAGQLDHCMSHLDVFLPVLLGFNPLHMVKDQRIEGWDHTLLSVTKRLKSLEDSGQGYILNPILGPEAITGSSRMKGGGATKLILEVCFLSAISFLISPAYYDGKGNVDQMEVSESTKYYTMILSLLSYYQQVWESSHQRSKVNLPKLLDQAGKSLLNNGHVYYIGYNTWGMLGLIDASECPPTFGSDFNDIRGFLKGGLKLQAHPQESKDTATSHELTDDETSLEFFETSFLPSVTCQDTVILLLPYNDENTAQEMNMILHSVRKKTEHIGVIASSFVDESLLDLQGGTIVHLGQSREKMTNDKQDRGPDSGLQKHVVNSVLEFALKSSLNAISTGAHIAKGKVYMNFMVDLRLSNSKLLERGIGIVARCAECSRETAREAVMRSIYRLDDLSSLRDIPVSSVIQTAGDVERVVPTAIIIAIKQCTVQEAIDHQVMAPIIRAALVPLLEQLA